MREYKFRGWSKELNKWVYGDLITRRISASALYAIIESDGHFKEVVAESVGQFTGLYDNTTWEDAPQEEKDRWLAEGHNEQDWKGREIYEGMIVEWEDTCEAYDSYEYGEGMNWKALVKSIVAVIVLALIIFGFILLTEYFFIISVSILIIIAVICFIVIFYDTFKEEK